MSAKSINLVFGLVISAVALVTGLRLALFPKAYLRALEKRLPARRMQGMAWFPIDSESRWSRFCWRALGCILIAVVVAVLYDTWRD